MHDRIKFPRRPFPGILVFIFLGIVTILHPSQSAGAQPAGIADRQASPSELINAVNALRLSYGLPPLAVHPILMQTAQSQANALLGSEGAVGHSRPGGLTYTEQLIQLGYPLAGDLSLGGYRSENYVFGNQLTVQDAIQFWLGDEPHTNTMLSPNYLDIGAGVAVGSDGTVYLVVDTARHTASGQPQSDAASVLTGTKVPQDQLMSQYIIPVSRSTARPDGIVYHKVQYGQSLWSIAIAYGTTIKSLQSLNNMGDTMVYDGQVLLVQRGATQPASPSPVSTGTPTSTPSATAGPATGTSPAGPSAVASPSPVAASKDHASKGPSLGLGLGILLAGMLIGATLAALFIRNRD